MVVAEQMLSLLSSSLFYYRGSRNVVAAPFTVVGRTFGFACNGFSLHVYTICEQLNHSHGA